MEDLQQQSTEHAISSGALRQFAENIRIFNKAVEMAIEENKKAGISEDGLYAL